MMVGVGIGVFVILGYSLELLVAKSTVECFESGRDLRLESGAAENGIL